MKRRASNYATFLMSIVLFSLVGAMLISAETESRFPGESNSDKALRNQPDNDLEESTPVSWESLVENYLKFREESWPMVIPAYDGEYFGSWDSIIANVGKRIIMGWFWYFDGGEMRLEKGELPNRKEPKPYEVVIFEDIYTSRVIVLGFAEGEKPIELYSRKVLPILDIIEDEFDIEAEICMRRMAIRLTALPFDYVAPKQDIQLFDLAMAKSVVPLRMMGGGYPADRIWLEIKKHEEQPNHFAGLTIHAPTSSVSRLDVFANSDLLDPTAWSLLVDAQSLNEEGLLAFTNTIVNFSKRYFLAANADAHSDDDGLSDGRERFLYFTSPYDEDTDGDSLPDGWEVQNGLDPNDDGSIDPENGPDGDPDEDGFSNQLEFELGAPANNPAWNGAELVYSLQRVHETTNEAKATSYTSLRVDIEDSENCGGSNANPQDVPDIFQVSSLLDCGYFVELIVTGDVEQNRSMYDHVFVQAYQELFYFGGLQNYETDCGLVMVNQTATNINLVLPNSQVILRYDTVSFKYHKNAYAQVIGVRTTGVLKIELPAHEFNYSITETSAGITAALGGSKPDDIVWSSSPAGISGSGESISFNPSTLEPDEYIVSVESDEFPCVNTSCIVRIFRPLLKEVSFSGTNNYTIKRDDAGLDYVAPHWKDNSTPLDGDADDAQDINYPICYARNSKMMVSAIWAFDFILPNIPFKVKGQGPNGLYFPETNAVRSGAELEIHDYECSTPFPNEVIFFDPMEIVWYFSFDNGATWHISGVSDNKTYVTLGAPSTNALYHTIIHIGCFNANGLTLIDDVVDSVWLDFEDRIVQRVDGTTLNYYTNANPFLSSVTLEGLLVTSDGQCTAWANLFHSILLAQGISDAGVYVCAPGMVALWNYNDRTNTVITNIVYGLYDGGFLIKNWILQNPQANTNDQNDNWIDDYIEADYPDVLSSWSQGDPGVIDVHKDFILPYHDTMATNSYQGTLKILIEGSGVKGQGDQLPVLQMFNHHYVVVRGEPFYDPPEPYTIYDPSYGTRYSGLYAVELWKTASIDGFFQSWPQSSNIVLQAGANDENCLLKVLLIPAENYFVF